MLRYGFIAAGNIIRAMYRGGELHADYSPSETGIFDTNENVRKDYASRGYKTFDSMTGLISNSGMIVLGVTPKVVGLIIGELKVCCQPGRLMLTVVAGVEQPWYMERPGENYRVVIYMPNINSQVGEGTLMVSRNTSRTDRDMGRVAAILKSCGPVEEIPDGIMAETLPFNSSAPGFFYHISDLMVKEAERYGLGPSTAVRLFAQIMKGSAGTTLSSNISLQEPEATLGLPDGTTVMALEKMEPTGFNAAYDEFVRISVERCKEPSGQ